MNPEVKVHSSYATLATTSYIGPLMAVFAGNEYWTSLSKRFGYSAAELHPFLKVADQVIQNERDLELMPWFSHIATAHAHINPYFQKYTDLLRQDPLRPSERLSPLNILFAPAHQAQHALTILSDHGRLVVNYANTTGKPNRYGEFRYQGEQVHHDLFGTRPLDEILNKKILTIVDSYHSLGSNDGTTFPWGRLEDREAWAKWIDPIAATGLLVEAHLQLGRTTALDPGIPKEKDFDNLIRFYNGENGPVRQFIHHLKEVAPNALWVVEITGKALVESKIISLLDLLPSRQENIVRAYKRITKLISGT